jgi:hypothetical protein
MASRAFVVVHLSAIVTALQPHTNKNSLKCPFKRGTSDSKGHDRMGLAMPMNLVLVA